MKLIASCLVLGCMFLCSQASANEAHVDSINGLGRDFIFSNVNRSINLYGDLVDESHQLEYDHGEALAWLNLAIAFSMKGLFDESTEAYLNAIRLLEQNNMEEDLARTYGDLGYQLKRHNLPMAKKYMRQGTYIAEKINFRIGLCALYDNYGVLQEMDAQPDSAAFYYRKALALKFSLNDSIGLPFSLNNLASLHATLGDFSVADSLLSLSDIYQQRPGNSYGKLVNGVHWSDLYLSRGDYELAEKSYLKSLSMPGALEQNYLIIHCYQKLAEIYEHQKDFPRAYASQKRFTAYRDSLITVETNSRIAGLEIEFESEQKDRLLAENQLAMETRSRQLMMLGALVVLVAVAGGGLLRHQLYKRRQLQQEMELRGQLRRSEFEQRMADEKLRISRELHDNIGAQLTFLVSSVDNLAQVSEESRTRKKLGSISEFGRTTLSELRQTVWAMKHGNDGIEALILKLHELKRQCSTADRVLVLEVDKVKKDAPKLSSARILNLYRITQEAVQNAIKHSEADEVMVILEVRSGSLYLIIEDNGQGFVEKDVDRVSGLDNMKGRCGEAGGELSIASDEKGTRVICKFPLE